MPDSLETREIEPTVEARAAVIWLHGLGADSGDFVPIVPELRLPESLAVRFVFPDAPMRPVTLNAGFVMRAWFDIVSLGMRQQEDEEGIRQSEDALRALIERERERGVAADKIVLAGFSQGGAVALQTGLRHPERLAGIVALSAWLPLGTTVAGEASPEGLSTPVFQGHGQFDSMVVPPVALASRAVLEALDVELEWHDYPMDHGVCPDEIRDVAAFLGRVLA